MKNQELRPNCEKILKEKSTWSLNMSDIENVKNFKEIFFKPLDEGKNFSAAFISKKYEIFKQLIDIHIQESERFPTEIASKHKIIDNSSHCLIEREKEIEMMKRKANFTLDLKSDLKRKRE
jgi:hypothetical protein